MSRLHRAPWVGFAAACLLAGAASPAFGQTIFRAVRYPVTIDPKAPLQELLPEPPPAAAVPVPWLVADLANVPEVQLARPEKVVVPKHPDEATLKKMSPEEREKLDKDFETARTNGQKQTARVLAKINHLNKDGTDHFIKQLVATRPDLAGLPFVMGAACRLSNERARSFETSTFHVTSARNTAADGPKFWKEFAGQVKAQASEKVEKPELEPPARVAALMQMVGPDNWQMHQALVTHLGKLEHADATRALARLAVYSDEESVREYALLLLKDRPAKDATDTLLAGLRHPWPAVVKNAGAAVVRLERKDLLPQLVALLDAPDPRAPAEQTVGGKKALAVRELVKINHHRNCALCHPPANTPDVKLNISRLPQEVVGGQVPTPGFAMPSPSRGYGRFESPDILVRADTTYLRQDFSLLLKVADADPWPEMQRFDFLVRTRVVTEKEAAAYREWLAKQGSGYLAPHRQAALTALRALTGRDAEPTAAAWRKVLGL